MHPEAQPYVPHGTSITSFERMSDAFSKYWLSDGSALHRFTQPEPDAAPHDHPMNIAVTVLDGGYVEEWFTPQGVRTIQYRHPGSTFLIPAEYIHRITALPTGECWTIARYGEKVREPCFWRWEDGKTWRRQWDKGWEIVGGE